MKVLYDAGEEYFLYAVPGANVRAYTDISADAYYAAAVTNAYRHAADAAALGEPLDPCWVRELHKVSHRPYCTGFFYEHSDAEQSYQESGYIRDYDFVGTVDGWENGMLHITQRNYFKVGETLEILPPKGTASVFVPEEIINGDGESVPAANHAMEKLTLPCPEEFPPKSMIRVKK